MQKEIDDLKDRVQADYKSKELERISGHHGRAYCPAAHGRAYCPLGNPSLLRGFRRKSRLNTL